MARCTVERLMRELGLRGLVVMALSSPDVAEHRIEASPFGAQARGEWSPPALGWPAVTSAFLEPDPAVEWDTGRIAAVRQALAALSVPEDTEQL